MSKRNYAPARLTTLNAALDSLSGTESDHAIAAGEAEQDTAERDAAYAEGLHQRSARCGTGRFQRQCRRAHEAEIVTGSCRDGTCLLHGPFSNCATR